MSLEPPFYVVSDTHWFHDNIVKYSDRHTQIAALIGPDTSKRIDHNWYMVEKWNSVIGPDDKILHLGDLFAWFKPIFKERFVNEILPKLNGDRYLLIGNHDRAKPSEFEAMGFKVLKPFTTTINGKMVSFDHYPWPHDQSPPKDQIHVHGHIHNNGYPITDNWRDGSVERRPRQINVSVEEIDYTPVAITDLIC